MSSAIRHVGILYGVVVLVCLLQLSLAVQETVKKCMEETGTSQEDIATFAEGKEPPASFKCLIKCCMKAHDMISDDGTFNKEKILSSLPDKYKEWLQSCFTSDGPDPDHSCEVAYTFNKCLMEANPKNYAALAELENN